jgi:hypothetical protein
MYSIVVHEDCLSKIMKPLSIVEHFYWFDWGDVSQIARLNTFERYIVNGFFQTHGLTRAGALINVINRYGQFPALTAISGQFHF